MIVISHSWEFVPKGSSHFYYHINSVKSSSSNNIQNNYNGKNTTINDILSFKNSLNNKNSKHRANEASCNTTNLDENRSINESYNPSLKLTFDNYQDYPPQEKWHLKQTDDYIENEIYIKDGTVILSNGCDFESKIVDKCYSFDSPVIDCNWFNFKSGLNDNDLITDAICVFELQKVHIYFPNGSDFHTNLSFKIKNCWKLKDGILIEKIPDSDSNTLINPYKPKQSIPSLFSLSHPLDELKPVMHKPNMSPDNKTPTYWKENDKFIIIDVIESLDLLLAFNVLSNVHSLYRINDVVYSEESDVAQSPTTSTMPNIVNGSKTPLNRAASSCLSINLQKSSKRRLSASPVVNNSMPRFNLLSPSVTTTTSITLATQSQNITTSTIGVATSNSGHLTLHAHHTHHHLNVVHTNRNFSPMAALSRSPSCSSSPAVLSLGTTVNSTNRRSLIPLPTLLGSASINPNNSTITNTHTNNANNQLNTFLTPSIECKTPINSQYFQKTPLNNNNILNNNSYTPKTLNNNDFMEDNSSDNEAMSEYVLEFMWNELGDSPVMEKATKFFYSIDLYNQKYVCYLAPVKAQLRLLKIEQKSDGHVIPIGALGTINNVKDAIFVETRNLMVILDTQGSLVVFSGVSKLCKLHIHNLMMKNQMKIPQNNQSIKSPVVSPLKLKLANLIDEESSLSSNEHDSSLDMLGTTNQKQKTSKFQFTLPNQNEFKSVFDSTGSRFTIKLSDSRLIRVNINEITTCKLVKMCLEAFKLTLNREIYYEIIQQWFIHRYTISESLSDQMNLFLYLIVNLCGCFDMKKLENEMKFLFSFNSQSKNKTNDNDQPKRFQQLYESEQFDDTLLLEYSNLTDSTASSADMTTNNKRVKCNETNITGTDDDWEFLLNHELIQKDTILNNEFSFLKANTMAKQNIKQQSRPQRNNTNKMTNQQATVPNTSGILYPFLKHILYTLHLVYEEAKLYRSLKLYLNNFIQVLYLFSLELNLTHYTTYYENECPILLSLKSYISTSQQSVNLEVDTKTNTKDYQLTPQAPTITCLNPSSSTFNNLRSKFSSSSQLNYIISQDPPNLHKFLLKLIEKPQKNETSQRPSNDESYLFEKLLSKSSANSIQNPYPILNNVSIRSTHAIKIYGLISLVCKMNCRIRFKDYLNQLILKINLTGFNNLPQNDTDYLNSNQDISTNKSDIYKNLFEICISDMNINIIDDLYDYPYLVQFPIFESIHYARENPCLEWPIFAFNLISRFDLEILKAIKTTDGNNNQNERVKSMSMMSGEKNGDNDELVIQVRQNLKKEEEDGMQNMQELEAYKCRFNEDLRLNEIRTCLQTTRPIQIKLTQGPDVSDHDFVEEEEKFLYCVCQRTMALPIGRGILTLHTVNPIPTEPVQIPELNLKGKSLTKKTTIDLTRIEVPINLTYWPLFHNGVAAGLTINSQANDLSNAWIKSHLAKNFELTNEQAGFLYGLGLTGHLSNLSMLNVHDALTRRHDLTNISILLGLSASKICSLDINVIRLISMHIRALMPPVEIELEIPYNIQIAALLSLGLVYAKSANKHISYVLLKEIGRLPNSELDKDVHTFDREAYSLSAGLALGLVLLEKGKESLTIMDSMFTDELYHYMVGGHKEKCNEVNFCATAASTSSVMMSNGQNTTRINVNNDHGNTSNIINSSTNNINFINYSKNINSSHIREGESINVNVTSPGATLALGLIYFNSGDKSIAEWFSTPDSIYLLDSIRPDFLLLRTLARNLIMWKNILPTKQWVLEQLPNILKKAFSYDLNLKKKFSKMALSNKNKNVVDAKNESDEDELNINYNETDTKAEAFQHIIAGICMSMALKFAGSCNNDAYHTLLYWARYFTDLNDQKLNSENCLCVVVLSLAIVMAGSGDLEVLRICRFLRSRVGPTYNHVLYGSHMAINMALSLLFMGGGRYTFKTDSLSVALMICAFYPHFPIDSNDNRFHLQAFRHLYVLSSESRLLLTKDVDSNIFCYVPIEIVLKPNIHYDAFKYTQMAPCILPELDKIKELKILGPRYYTIKFSDELNFIDLKNILTSHLYVKQKNGYFSYSDDPQDEKAYNIRNFLSKTIVPRRITPELLESITNEEYINLFAQMLNKSNENDESNDKTNRLLKIMYESVIQETFDFVGIILQLDKEVNEDTISSSFIAEMNLINAFYRIIPPKKNHIIGTEFLISTINTLETRIRRKINNNPINLIKSYLNTDYTQGTDDLIHFCVYYDINQAELAHFLTCNDLIDLLNRPPSNNIRVEKLLNLYQAINIKQK